MFVITQGFGGPLLVTQGYTPTSVILPAASHYLATFMLERGSTSMGVDGHRASLFIERGKTELNTERE